MMSLKYKLKITTKTEKTERSLKILKMYNIGNFRIIRIKLTELGNIMHSIIIHEANGTVQLFIAT